ncbi:MAG: esterase [Flavobacteriaceae bacterium]|nr:esterase [Flavobacteriaceae bacterium]|tara:strand:+ start:6967 stop:8142 length:1176 start_codon:yes stop_codon:yes gene_type:complete
MKNIFSFIIISFILNLGFSQNLDSLNITKINDTIFSKFLNKERSIEIQLPRSFNENDEKKFPLVIVLDGDYMFNMVSGSIDYLSYWGDIPENIVVGIKQNETRYKDVSVLDNINNTPITSTLSFYNFIENELIPYISKNYRGSTFRIIIGQERTANFINFFLLKENPIIRGYISVSPKFSKNMDKYLIQKLNNTKNKVLYVISSSKNDFKSIYEDVLDTSKSLDSIKNKNVKFKSFIFNNENHYVVPSVSIPSSIRSLYSIYSDIDRIEYDSIISKLEIPPLDYLLNKYELIKDFYDIEKRISINDFMAIEEYIELNEMYEFFDDLSKLAIQEYPQTILPSYYKGRFYEETGNPRKAMHIYRSAYNMDNVSGLTKDYLIELADKIKSDFNF